MNSNRKSGQSTVNISLPAGATQLVSRYGAYIVGFLGALGALVAAYFMPASRATLVGGAGAMASLTFFLSKGKRVGYRALGMLAAGATVVAAYLMPDQSKELLEGAGVIAAVSLIWF